MIYRIATLTFVLLRCLVSLRITLIINICAVILSMVCLLMILWVTRFSLMRFSRVVNYAARIDNLRCYDMVSKDIIHRWTYPYVPDIRFSGNRPLKLGKRGTYRASDAVHSRSADIGASTVIGNGCSIGSDVVIRSSYIWNNVTIEDGCEIRNAIVCDGVQIRAGAVLQPGVVLSFNVVVGRDFFVPAYSKVSLLQQPTKEDSDEEPEYVDSSSGTADFLSGVNNLQMESKASELGPDGAGYIWEVCDSAHDEEWKHSVVPIPMDKLADITQAMDDDDIEDESVVPPSEELKSDSDSFNTDANNPSNDNYGYFEREVEKTFLKAIKENAIVDIVIPLINSDRFACNMASADCAGAVFYSMMRLAVDTPHNSASELYRNATSIITKWKGLLGFYVKQTDEQIEVIMKFEEMCQESAELGPLFAQIVHFPYDKDVVQEDAILRWGEEKAGAEESDKVYLNQCEAFIQWLKEAFEEEEEEEDS